MDDKFSGHPTGLDTPAVDWEVITPHDTNPLPFYPKGIMVGATGGTVVCISRSGKTATFQVPAGGTLRVRPHIITAASTATPIIGLKE